MIDPPVIVVQPQGQTVVVGTTAMFSVTATGAIRVVRIGRSVRYAVADLERFVAERQGAADAR